MQQRITNVTDDERKSKQTADKTLCHATHMVSSAFTVESFNFKIINKRNPGETNVK